MGGIGRFDGNHRSGADWLGRWHRVHWLALFCKLYSRRFLVCCTVKHETALFGHCQIPISCSHEYILDLVTRSHRASPGWMNLNSLSDWSRTSTHCYLFQHESAVSVSQHPLLVYLIALSQHRLAHMRSEVEIDLPAIAIPCMATTLLRHSLRYTIPIPCIHPSHHKANAIPIS